MTRLLQGSEEKKMPFITVLKMFNMTAITPKLQTLRQKHSTADAAGIWNIQNDFLHSRGAALQGAAHRRRGDVVRHFPSAERNARHSYTVIKGIRIL